MSNRQIAEHLSTSPDVPVYMSGGYFVVMVYDVEIRVPFDSLHTAAIELALDHPDVRRAYPSLFEDQQ